MADEYTNSSGLTGHKAPRVRSSAYPPFSLPTSLDFVKKFHQNFGTTTFTTREHAAKVLGMSLSNVVAYLSAATQYDLCEMKVKEGYKPSNLFIRIYRPIDETEKKEALLIALYAPDLYNRLLGELNNTELPSLAGLATILFRKYNIAEAASKGAARVFLDNLEWMELVKDGVLKINTHSVATEPEVPVETIEAQPYRPQLGYSPEKKQDEKILLLNQEQYSIPIPLKGGRSARLIVPDAYTNEDLDKIVKFIDALRE
jgi:hypothetical protein